MSEQHLFLSIDPQQVFSKPASIDWIEWDSVPTGASLWVHCYDARGTLSPDWNSLFLVFSVMEGPERDLWFPNRSLRVSHGLIVWLSTDQFNSDSPTDGSTVQLRVRYTKDSVAALQEAVRAELERRVDDPHTVTVSLPDFFRTGALGPIRTGMSRQELRDTLGNPDEWSYVEVRKDIPPRIYKYGAMEFYFGDDDRLFAINSDDFDVLHGGAAIRFDPWIMRRGMTLDDIQHQLELHAIDYQTVKHPGGDNTAALRVGAGVHLLFSDREAAFESGELVVTNGPMGLYGLSFGLDKP